MGYGGEDDPGFNQFVNIEILGNVDLSYEFNNIVESKILIACYITGWDG